MALLSFSSSLQLLTHTKFYTKKHKPPIINMSKMEAASKNTRKEDIVIVGAGIAGLATALSLHRLGVGSLVVEQSESMRTGGTSLTLFKNGWRVLDALGVADELRAKFSKIHGMVLKSYDGRELRSFIFEKEAPGQEVRAVERRVLLDSLASRLPSDRILYASKLKSLEKQGESGTVLQLEDGSQLLAKIVIGCDGVRSPIAKWLGFSEPNYVGYSAFRGLANYPKGHSFEPNVNYIYGRGLRAGYLPISSTKVYWFLCYNSPLEERSRDHPSALKQEASEMVKSWPSELQDIIQRTADDIIVKTPLVDRWLWPGTSPAASRGNAVLVGDAWHPMTPNLGQGACCALEDSVVLAGKLAGALAGGGGRELVDGAFGEYERERWRRVFPLTVRSNLVGALLQIDDPVVCGIRDKVVIAKLLRMGPMLEHTDFECDLRQVEPVASV